MVPAFVTTQAQLHSLALQNPEISENYAVAALPAFGGSRCRVDAPTVAVAVHMSGSDPVLSRKFLEYCRFSEDAKAYPGFYIGEGGDQGQDLSENYKVLGKLNAQPGKNALTAMDLAEYLAEYRENMKAMLDSLVIQEEDGTRHALRQKDNIPIQ